MTKREARCFVSENDAAESKRIINTSKVEPLVVRKHFDPNCPGVSRKGSEG